MFKSIVFICGMTVSVWAVNPSDLFQKESSNQEITLSSCLERIEIKNTLTPEQLFQSSALCIQEEKYAQAVELYLISTAYGYYDTQRVIDRNARSILETLKTKYFGGLEATKRNAFAEALRTRLDDMRSMCGFLEKLGRPNYHPRYMLDDNIPLKTPQKPNNGLVPNYNEKALWDDTRLVYLRCQ